MEKILFVCHGNICRSVMAQWIFQDLVHQHHLDDQFEIDSAAVSSEETGNRMHPPARRKLTEKGIPFGEHRARRMTHADYDHFDHIYIMDDSNRRLIRRIVNNDPDHKIELLKKDGSSISDPWYTGDFEQAYQDIVQGCKERLDEILSQ